MTITSIKEAQQILSSYLADSGTTERKTTLARMWPLLELIGNPQDKLRAVHIAGTSGKTSTSYYVAALLTATGKRVGLTVSPHVNGITERIQINGKPIEEAEFCELLGEFLELITPLAQKPTHFELLYSFVIWVFARKELDYAVIETGVGGLLDATNVITRSDKVCIITDIGFDHMHILGETLPEIAAQKIGIAHGQNHIFTYEQDPSVMAVFERAADQKRGELHRVDVLPAEHVDASLQALPSYQQRNWWLAKQAYEYIANRDGLQHLTSQALTQTMQTYIPGRMETKQLGGKLLVMDGAHNEQKITAFMNSFTERYPNVRPAVLIALKQTKDYEAVAGLLSKITDHVITTSIATSQDMWVQSVDPELLAQSFRQAGVTKAEAISDNRTAVEVLLSLPDKVAVITGSFYMLSQLRTKELI